MFSGIIQDVGIIKRAEKKQGGREFEIATRLKRKWKIGESVSIAGICSTVLKKTAQTFTVFHMPETLAKTTSALWGMGSRVDIEPSLKMGDDISGHNVSGHVDGMSRVKSITGEGECKRIVFSLSKELIKYLIPKGSVAVDGVSLTVVAVGKDSFSVALIPYTLLHTTLGLMKKGDSVNIEVDMTAKYIEKFLAARRRK